MKSAGCAEEQEYRNPRHERKSDFVTRTQLSAMIDEHVFSERDRMILKRRLLDGIVFEQLAEEFNLSDRQVKRIVYKLQDRVFKNIKR